jgi:hypothetical protein
MIFTCESYPTGAAILVGDMLKCQEFWGEKTIDATEFVPYGAMRCTEHYEGAHFVSHLLLRD